MRKKIKLSILGMVLCLSSSAQAKTEDCQATNKKEIEHLFDRWNSSLQTGNPEKVVENYAEKSVLLPTLSNEPRLDKKSKIDYFRHFLTNKPFGIIDSRNIEIECNAAVDTGLYTFKFSDGSCVKARYTFTYAWNENAKTWLITSHHSSLMPTKISCTK